jgi:hypothetical protein
MTMVPPLLHVEPGPSTVTQPQAPMVAPSSQREERRSLSASTVILPELYDDLPTVPLVLLLHGKAGLIDPDPVMAALHAETTPVTTTAKTTSVCIFMV